MKFTALIAVAALSFAAENNVPKVQQEKGPQGIEFPLDVDNTEGPKYPTFGTKDYFRMVFENPVPSVQLSGPTRLADFVVDGKFELSLRSYIELVLGNNTDIQIQKVLVEPQRNAITRSFSPFDPLVQAGFNASRAVTPATNVLEGAQVVGSLTQPANLRYQQMFQSGTQLSASYAYQRFSSNNINQRVNPSYNNNINVNFLQPLLRNRGLYINRVPIFQAKSRLTSAQQSLEDQLIRLLTQAETAYWDVVGARESLKVAEQSLSLADTSLKRAQRELELGAISALEIFQPQAQYARAEIFVTQARYRLQQTEDVLRRQISIDLAPELRTLPIVLTESVLPPTDNTPFDRERLVTDALRNRPDLQAARTNLDVDEYGIKIASNNLRPDFGVTGTYSTQGIGGNTLLNSGTTLPGGFGDAWSQMWGFNYPIYGFGFQLRLPIKDRRAIADYADAVVAKRMDTLRVRSIEQQTRQDVLNAVSQVENSRASVDLAKIAADFAQKRVEADQKRYDLGTITLFFLLSSQNDLTQAQSDLVNNSIQYRRNLLNLSQRTGSLLVDRGIVIK
jgi:outer membrane protein TolC